MTTVSDLIERLTEMPKDAQVLITLDEGVNDPGHPVGDVFEAITLKDEVEDGEAFITFDEDFGGEVPDEYQTVVVLMAD